MEYFFIYKPYGMLSQFSKEHPEQCTLADLEFSFPKDVYPVGRLDADSEGLLLLTNDKSLNFNLLNPKRHAPKTYFAQVEGSPSLSQIDQLRHGVHIQINGRPHQTLPAKVEILEYIPDLPVRVPPIRFRKMVPDAWLSLTLIEGKNRQVRRMCAAVGLPVLRLVRVEFAGFRLGTSPLENVASGAVWAVDFKKK